MTSDGNMMETFDITVAVATHRPYRMPEDPCYLPLHVGAALHPKVCNNMQPDDSGDNISDKNNAYSELTGLYWLWKNCRSEYKGLVHYRRHFRSTDCQHFQSKDRFECIATTEDYSRLIVDRNAQVIVPKARNYVIETIESHYCHTLPGEQLSATRDVLSEKYSKYLGAFDDEMSCTKAHMFNMLVAEREIFDSYCAWLFSVLGDIETRVDSYSYDAFNARWPGRISELLLDTWMATEGVKWTEMPTVSPEPVNWLAKGRGFLAAKFLGKKYERSF